MITGWYSYVIVYGLGKLDLASIVKKQVVVIHFHLKNVTREFEGQVNVLFTSLFLCESISRKIDQKQKKRGVFSGTLLWVSQEDQKRNWLEGAFAKRLNNRT